MIKQWDTVRVGWDVSRWNEKLAQHFDDSEWVVGAQGTWNGTGWDATLAGVWQLFLDDIGSWATGYRPTMVRFTIVGDAAVSIAVQDDISGILSISSPYLRGDFVPLSFAATDGFKVAMSSLAAYTVTNIEFLQG